MLEKFIKEEELKDYLLAIVKNDPKQRMKENIIEPAGKIVTQILDAYSEIFEEEGKKEASNYLFHSMANNVLLIVQLHDMNKELIENMNELLEELNG